MSEALQCGHSAFIALKRTTFPDEYVKTFPLRHRGHLPFQSALINLTEAILAGSVPKIRDHCNREIRHKEEIKYPEVDTSGDPGIAIADIVLKCGPAT